MKMFLLPEMWILSKVPQVTRLVKTWRNCMELYLLHSMRISKVPRSTRLLILIFKIYKYVLSATGELRQRDLGVPDSIKTWKSCKKMFLLHNMNFISYLRGVPSVRVGKFSSST